MNSAERTLSRRHLVADFSILFPEHLHIHQLSPLDIDHWPCLDAILLFDRTGDLEERRRRIAAFPETGWKERVIDMGSS